MNIIGIPKIAPIPVMVRIVPTSTFSSPTALRVGAQKRGRRRITIKPVRKLEISSEEGPLEGGSLAELR